ncbi:MAG: HmuY family protein [Bacteroidetes bacterium]|jgi:hypothetical protein|nr:HmuY family protein [Bacteroidota bacterium]HQW46436.1 HmuY family protein [Chitinophagaceae bacterium]MBK6821019.1 HmuY family protein [Bacteroidota bacterium]MBK7039204.1 HmuY family protein [Bacteroidota bacterium]MBK7587331.1 HmuY family protein [Bacteroidota bacterium]
MSKPYSILVFLFVAVLLSSCEKKDTSIILPPKGNGTAMQVDMGENYDYQYFISLQQNSIVHISPTKNWDLAFSCDPNSHAIFLNGAKLMSGINTHKLKMTDVGSSDTTDKSKSWTYDNASGNIDSTVIGDWKQNNEVYIIKLSNTNNHVRKIKIISSDIFEYTLQVAELNATNFTTIKIPKKATQNYTYFSFDLLTEVPNVEPDKDTWDLQVTLFNYTFYDQNPILPYVVNGVLINPNGTTAYKDSLSVYNNIDAAFALSVPLSPAKDVIGFDWKKYDIDKNLYTVDNRYSYIVKTKSQSYFKLHFLDFYGPTGIKGSPKFEFEQLK